MVAPLTSVPGQVTAGFIDGYLRDDAGDGTLGVPDLSLVPYTYAPLLGPVDGDLRWVIDEFKPGGFGAFKGSSDGLGALRSTGADNGAFMVQVIPQATGTKLTPPPLSTLRDPDWTWGPRDFALAIRHPGTSSWDASNVRAYLAFMQATNTVGIQMTTPVAFGPWDTERADTSALSLGASGRPNLWDGASHTITVATFGSHVLCTFDWGVHCATFRAPRSYQHALGLPVTGVYSNLPTSGPYGGYDARGSEAYLYSWTALQGASGDFFYYDEGALAVQVAPTTTYTPTVLPSGETWNLTGTVTASKNGILLAASSTAYFNVAAPHGLVATRWGAVQSGGGLLLRRTDASNYYLLSSTGLYRYTAGVLSNTLVTFTTPLATGDYVTLRNLPNQMLVWVNGQQVANVSPSQGSTSTGIGFLSPSSGSSQFRFIGFQPLVNLLTQPTS